MEVRGQRAEVCYRELMMSGCDSLCSVTSFSELGIPRVAPSRTWKPICRFGGAGGSVSSRMASKTTLNWASYLFSRAASLRASSVFERSISRKRTNVRMIAMLTCTARGLRRTLESIATPCEPHKLEIRNAKREKKSDR